MCFLVGDYFVSRPLQVRFVSNDCLAVVCVVVDDDDFVSRLNVPQIGVLFLARILVALLAMCLVHRLHLFVQGSRLPVVPMQVSFVSNGYLAVVFVWVLPLVLISSVDYQASFVLFYYLLPLCV